MANFVLVHGAWHGGWCYRDTARALRAQGHTVVTPTHTGVGERTHLSNQAITLETHIRDVVGCIEWEDLDDIVLCGHSYGGMVITGVADRMHARVRALVYLDAFVPGHGDSLIGLIERALEPEVAAQFVGAFRGAALEGNSGMMQPIPAAMFNIAAQNQAWVDAKCVPQALATFEVPLLLSGGIDHVRQRHYILADGWDPSPFRHFAAKYDGADGWTVTRMPCSHDVMVDMPDELAAYLARLA
ncbi:MAG: alpha/beta hydrolase [Burkholderiales bacterium]|nr:MAG: alpha/beta hydrolase [Burkholderiales bacterium]